MLDADLQYQKRILLADILGLSMTDLLIQNPNLNLQQKEAFERKLILLKQGYPVDYLLHTIKFAGIKLSLTSDVLIPRSETEEWIERLVKYDFFQKITDGKKLKLIDIGTGSGAIGISLSFYFNEVFLVDISVKALKVAKANSKLNNTVNVSCLKSDLLNSFCFQNNNKFQKKYIDLNSTILVANLPYLPNCDEPEINKTNVRYEPKLALYSGEDGLDLFKKLLKQLNDLPVLSVFELDPRNIRCAKKLLSQLYTKTFIWNDSFGKERLLIGQI